MAPQKSPAFQFYAKDFLTGTATMSLAERGAYVTLLAHQWDAGTVPSAAKERARILGCTAAEERRIWARLVSKFTLVDDAFQNLRLEEERAKQAEFRRRQSDRGKASAAARETSQRSNAGSTGVQPRAVESRLQPESNSSVSSLQSSSSKEQETTKSGPVIVGPAQFARLQETNAFVGSVLKVPKKLHAELLAKSGGAHREPELQNWYLSLNDQLETSGKGTGDVFEFLRPRHQAHAKFMGWIEDAPKANGKVRDNAALMARLEAIERGEIKR